MKMKLGRVSYPPSLKEVTLTIPRGITYLSGSNGAGKSTLLDCLSGVNPCLLYTSDAADE